MVLNDCLLLCFGVNWLCERWWFYVITHVGILRSRWCTLKGGTGCSIKFYSGSSTLRLNSLPIVILIKMAPFYPRGWRGGGGGDAHRKIRVKTLKETNLGMGQALFDP